MLVKLRQDAQTSSTEKEVSFNVRRRLSRNNAVEQEKRHANAFLAGFVMQIQNVCLFHLRSSA